MCKTIIATAGLLAFLGVSAVATAAETVVRSESSPSVTVEKRDDVVERRSVTTDCGSKTVHKEDSAGNSKTVHKEGC